VDKKPSSEDAAAMPEAVAKAHAEETLSGLNAQIIAMRSVLTRLLQDVVQADTALNSHQGMQMLEANEFLTLSALHAQTQAETSAMKLEEVALATGLDPLTGLPNRVLFLDRLEHAIQVAKRGGTRLAVLFVDLDNFKQINDDLGHAVGDEVLKMTARCLTDAVRAVDTVGRHGGDEFLLLLAGVTASSHAVAVAEKIGVALDACAGLQWPARAGTPAMRLSASIGISIYPDHGMDSATLIEHADTAMYRVKRSEVGGYVVHGEPMSADHKQVFSLSSKDELKTQHGKHQSLMVDMQLRHQILQEANERLVLAALSAQELQAAAEQALRRQSEFLNDVKNELRDPSAPIRIATSMLGRRRTDEPLLPLAQAMVEKRTEALARVVGVVTGVVTGVVKGSVKGSVTGAVTEVLSRDVSNGLLKANPGVLQTASNRFKPVDLRRVIETALASYAPELKRRSQRIELRVADDNLMLSGEAVHLIQALSNLLNNASKYTRNQGVITLEVTATPRELILTVSDNGIGISAAILPKVFDPFVQDTHAIGFNGVGLGIGLTAVREVIEAHCGSVEARSAGEGQGSQFIVTLPRLTDA
jgi:diguanylate cyclase